MSRKRDVKEVAGLLRATPALLHSELAALPAEIWRWRPAPAEWCINEIIGHLTEADRNGFDGRIRTILAAEGSPQPVNTWDIQGRVAERRDHQRDGLVLLEELAAGRETSAGLVVGLTPAQLQWAAIHPDVGGLRVIDLLHEWIHHDRRHIKQILSNVQAFVWPHMGNAQRFSALY